MKITTFYRGEIEVNVTSDDITVMLLENPERSPANALRMINEVVCALKGVPDEIIAKMTESQRKLIREFLELQAKRYEEAQAEVK